MKSLFLDRTQAKQLATDLLEYVEMSDSSNREVFKGFKLQFGDLAAEDITHDGMELTAIPNFTSVEGSDDD
jgi:hypothetical protein